MAPSDPESPSVPTAETVPSSPSEEEGTNTTYHPTSADHGSSVIGAILNFTNSIIGAGAIGLGGAIAVSGGAISVFLILFFGVLTKLSLDLVVRLSIETEGAHGSYEDLAYVGLGRPGRSLVSACKLLYSFGCLVAYIVVLKDNFGPALRNLIYGDVGSDSWVYEILKENAYFTWIVSSGLILPLCMLRDMTPLASFSMLSVVSMAAIVVIVIYIYFANPEIRTPGGTFYENWLQIRPGILDKYGSSVIPYVAAPFFGTSIDSLFLFLSSAWGHLCLRSCHK
jgi:amino acid permease